MAERAGFEPAVRFWRTHAFQACTFDRSVTSPFPASKTRRGFYLGPLQHLTGIHDPQRIERALDRAHDRHFHRRLVALDLLALVLPDPVLGADRAVKSGDAVVHDEVDLGRARGEGRSVALRG